MNIVSMVMIAVVVLTCSKCRADWSFDEDDWFLNQLGSSDEEDDDE